MTIGNIYGNPVGDQSLQHYNSFGFPYFIDREEVNPFDLPFAQTGAGFFDWLKRIFRSPVTKRLAKSAVSIGKAVLPSAERAVMGELARSKKGQKIAKAYEKGKKIGKLGYKLGEKVYKAAKGSGLAKDDPAYNLAMKIDRMYSKKGGMSLGSPYKSQGMGLELAGAGMVGNLLSRVFIPQLLGNIRRRGFKFHRRPSKRMKNLMRNNFIKILKRRERKSGGAIGAVLASLLPTLIPLGINLASEAIPMITQLLTPKGRRVGSGAIKVMKKALAKDILKFLQKENKTQQYGSGFLDFIKNIGSKVIGVIRKIFPVAKRVAKAVVPVLEPAVLKELSKSEKGQKIASMYQKGKKVGTDVYQTGRKIYEAYKE
jgi:hypothetical protein